MKNLDTLKAQKAEAMEAMRLAVESNNSEAFAEAFANWADSLQQATLAEARGLIDAADNDILLGRGVRQLTSEERTYYNQVMDAMRSSNPQQSLSDIDKGIPTTIIDAVLEDIIEFHPLLSEIDMQNTGVLTSILVTDGTSRVTAIWGDLCDEITKELAAGFDTIDLAQKKLSAFIPVCKAMLEVGPGWLDRYVRALLAESIANGVEKAVINGDGLKEPVGMMRNLDGAIDQTTGYPAKDEVTLSAITPSTIGSLIAGLAVNRNGLSRPVTEIVFIVNPVTNFAKVMPALTRQTADGSFVQRWPFPTKVIQSVHVPANKAVVGLAKRYFFGLGTGKGGRIDYSDHYKFLEDQRVYLTKLYGDGRPKDNTSFAVCNITGLVPTIPDVNIPGGVVVTNDPLEVSPAPDARLASLKLGTLDLDPGFNKSIFYYETDVTAATTVINAVAMNGEAEITIDVDETPVTNGGTITWGADGEKVVTIEVEVGDASETYTVVVTKGS